MESAAETKIAHAVYYFCSSLFEVIVFRFSSLLLRGNPAEPACLSHPQSLMTAAEDEKKKRLIRPEKIPHSLPSFFSANRFSLPSISPLPPLSLPLPIKVIVVAFPTDLRFFAFSFLSLFIFCAGVSNN